MPNLLTIGDVAAACGVKIHVARYAVAEYRIEPYQRVGIVRVWHPDQLPEIKSALQRIADRRRVNNA
jgi:hypothetical protein